MHAQDHAERHAPTGPDPLNIIAYLTALGGNGLTITNGILAVNVDGTTIEISSDALRVKDAGITQAKLAAGYRATYFGAAAPGSPSAGDHWYDDANDLLHAYNGTSWVCITPQSATVVTNETTATAAYVNLATTGPVVSVQTDTKALVTMYAAFNSAAGAQYAFTSFAVSGATTIAVNDTNAAGPLNIANLGNGILARTLPVTGLTAGVNTFTMLYKIGNATTTAFLNRSLTVVGIP